MENRHRRQGEFDDAVGDAANVLVLSPSLEERTRAGCATLLGAPGAPDSVVFVSLVRRPSTRLEDWRERCDHALPERIGVVAMGGTGRGGGSGQERHPIPGGPAPARVEYVSQSVNPTALWSAVGGFLDAWDAGRTALCFDSLTVLLQYLETKRAFRFCHALAGRIRTAGDTAHYHLDPGTVDRRIVRTLSQVFDAVVELDDGAFSTRYVRES